MKQYLKQPDHQMNLEEQDASCDNGAKPELSIVIPACNEEGNIRPLYRELIKVLATLDMLWEVIFVDDGSQEGTWEEVAVLLWKLRMTAIGGMSG